MLSLLTDLLATVTAMLEHEEEDLFFGGRGGAAGPVVFGLGVVSDSFLVG